MRSACIHTHGPHARPGEAFQRKPRPNNGGTQIPSLGVREALGEGGGEATGARTIMMSRMTRTGRNPVRKQRMRSTSRNVKTPPCRIAQPPLPTSIGYGRPRKSVVRTPRAALREDDVEPESDRCVMIFTRSSMKEMLAPGLLRCLHTARRRLSHRAAHGHGPPRCFVSAPPRCWPSRWAAFVTAADGRYVGQAAYRNFTYPRCGRGRALTSGRSVFRASAGLVRGSGPPRRGFQPMAMF